MIPTAAFGRTGHESTRVIFGAAALAWLNRERAAATLAQIDAAGINHIDTAAGYGDSELHLRPFLAGRRDRFFVATKTNERAGSAARAELERSLERMGVDRVDLIQLHNLVEPDEWDIAFAPDGAVAALERARDEGLVGAVGVTGHGLRIAEMHRRSLERSDFASVLLPYNRVLMLDDEYRAAFERLREMCAERAVAVQTIKAIAKGRWASPDPYRLSWCEPITDPAAISRAVRWVLASDDLFVNTTSDARLLDAVIGAASEPVVAPDEAELDADIEAFGITPLFDGGQLERI